MWRAFFFAIGTMLVIIGVECLMIDSATLAAERQEPVQAPSGWFQSADAAQARGSNRIIRPAEWTPWSLIASGAVVLLYALTIPRRWGAKKPGE